MPKYILNEEIVKEIKSLLKSEKYHDIYQIGDAIKSKYNISFNSKQIGAINLGRAWYSENDAYPISKKYIQKILGYCCVKGCNKHAHATFTDGHEYCKRHYMQMYHHNQILSETIFDKNDYIEHGDYIEIILKNKDFDEVGRTLIDIDDKEKVLKYKWYCHQYENNKKYCQGTLEDGYKIRLHQFVLGLSHNDEKLKDKVIDHINGNSLDNRKSNLRIVSQKENMENTKPRNPMVGIRIYETASGKLRYGARISSNYKSIDLGTYDSLKEAQDARKAGELKYWSKKVTEWQNVQQ